MAGTAVVVGMGLLLAESYSDLEASITNLWRQPPYVGPIVTPARPPPEQLQSLQAQIAETSSNLDRLHAQELEDTQRRDALQQQLSNLNSQVAQATQDLAQAKKELAGTSQRKPAARKAEASRTEKPPDDVDSREAILSRLRRPPPVAVVADTAPAPRERLVAARQALVEGRITDAENLLQQAQTQMVFSPVTPQDGNLPPKPNPGASRIDKALERIQVGDVQRALNFIDQAMKTN